MPNWKKLIVSGSDATLNNLNVTNAVTASYFKGDGSGLSNVTTTIAEIASKPDTFSNTTSKVITHNFGSKDVIVSVFDSTDNLIIPESIATTDDNNVTITFAENTTGRAVVARGGHIVSGTVDYNQLSNVPSSLVSSSIQLASDISGSFTATSASLASAIANSTSDYTELSNIPGGIISSSKQLPSNIVSSSLQLGSKISGSFTATSASLAAAIAAVSTDFSDITNKPTLISSSNQIASDISGSFTATSASFATTIGNLTSDYTELTNIPSGIISASSGKVVLPQTAPTIGGSNLSNATLLVGTTSLGIGFDNNEIVNKGDHLYFGTVDAKNIYLKTANADAVTILSNQNVEFAGDVTTSGNIILSGASNEIIKSNGSIRLNIDSDNNQTDRVFIVSTGANSELFKVDESGNGTFAGDVTVAGAVSASNIQIGGLIRRTGDSNTFISMSDDHMSFTAGNAKFIDYDEGYNGAGSDDRLIINPDKISALDFYVYGNNNNEAMIRTDAGTNKLWFKYQDDEGSDSNQIDRRTSTYYKGVNIRSNVLIDESKLYIKDTNGTSDNEGGNIILQRIGDNNIASNEVLGGILFTGDDTDAPISGSVGFAIQARATGGWVSGSYPTKLVFYSGEKGHENWPDQGMFRIDPDGKTHIGDDSDPEEMVWVSGSIESYVKGSHISASRVIGESITGSLDYSNIVNLPTLVSSSNQLASDISGSFTATSSSLASRISSNETITAKTLISSSNQIASDISGSITLTSASLAGGRLKNTTDTLTGNLTVTGTINATKINTTIVSSSIAFSSGSNIFGDEASDEHEFTGSIDLTGPITASFLKGDGSALTNLTLSSGIISSSQQLPSGIISSSQQFPSSIISSSKQLPSGIISSSQQLPSNIVSSSAQLSEFSGSFSGSFEGDGSALTGVVANVTQEVTVTDTFSSVTSKAVTHNFGTKNVIVSVYDSNDQVIIPASITTTNVNVVTVTFATATSGRVVVAKGGHIVSGSMAVEIVEETTVLDTFTSSTSKAVTHNFGTKNVLVSVYDNTDKMIIPQEIVTTDINTVTITLATATTGRVIVAKGGHLVSGSSEATVDFGAVGSHILPSTTEIYDLGSSSKRWRDIYLSGSTIDLGGTKITRDGDGDIEFKDSNNNLKKVRAAEMVIGTGGTVKRMKLVGGKVVTTDNSGNVEHPATASYALTASFVEDSFISASAVRSGFGAGGTDISALSITGSGFTNASTVAVNHGFGTKEVVVSVYDNGDNLIMPSNIKTTTTGSVDITFAQPRTGRVVVSKGGHVVTSVTGFNAATAEALTAAGSRQGIVSVTTAVTASLFSTHLLRGHISMSLPSAVAGDWVKVSNRITSSYAHLVPGGAQKIMGSTDSLQIDSDNAGFELIYADSTDGWVIIGQ